MPDMTTTGLTHSRLKERHRQERGDYPEDVSVRLHRALSWLQRAESCLEDDDARFIFLWIAFNAAYARECGDYDFTEQEVFRHFIDRLVALDREQLLFDTVWSEFSGPVRVLLDNPFVFKPFWDFHAGRGTEWEKRFAQEKTKARKALADKDTKGLLGLIFSRLYVLRNQIVHGGATWNSTVNRDQVRDCAAILGKIVPLVIQILMDHPDKKWGELSYPVVS